MRFCMLTLARTLLSRHVQFSYGVTSRITLKLYNIDFNGGKTMKKIFIASDSLNFHTSFAV